MMCLRKKEKYQGSNIMIYHDTITISVSCSILMKFVDFIKPDYCHFDIIWKDVFCLALYFKSKYFVLIDHILSEIICLFCFCVLFSNIYPKIKFMAKNWSDLCNFYS